MMDEISERLANLESWQEEMRGTIESVVARQDKTAKCIERMQTSLIENTTATVAVKADTEELITLLRGSKLFAKVITWTVGIVAGIATAWAALKGR